MLLTNRNYSRIIYRVNSGIFGQTAKFGQPPCLFHSSIIGIKNKLTKQTVKILMRRLIRSRLIWISTVCKRVSEFTRLYPISKRSIMSSSIYDTYKPLGFSLTAIVRGPQSSKSSRSMNISFSLKSFLHTHICCVSG